MKNKTCYTCNKEHLGRNELGLTKKILGRNSKNFFCLHCLAEYLEVDSDCLLAKIEEFKEQGCTLF